MIKYLDIISVLFLVGCDNVIPITDKQVEIVSNLCKDKGRVIRVDTTRDYSRAYCVSSTD